MGFASFHAHKAHHRILPRAASAGCTTGGFYTSPANDATLDSSQPLLIKWDPSCLDSQKLDIHLLAPGFNGANTEITVWPGILNADAQKSVAIQPQWWNSTSQVQVQLVIVPAGLPSAMTPLPAGPLFTFTSNGTTTDSPLAADAAAGIAPSGTSKSPSPGATAAAVILLLLFVGLAIFAYMRYQRRRASAKSKRFSQALDKRMSTISADWKSISAAGAQAAIRNSIAPTRDSVAFSFGHVRPSIDAPAPAAPAPMKQVRTGTGVGLRNPGAAAAIAAERASRVSRVSFADTLGRPSTDSRRTRGAPTRGSAYVPPVPSRKDIVSGVPSVYPDSEIDGEIDRRAMSPRQTSGPLTLTPEDIQARMHGRLSPAREKNEEYDEVMPALSMMRLSSNITDTYLLPQAPAPSASAAHTPPCAFTHSAYTHQQDGQMMSPDAMLQAYAVRAPPSSHVGEGKVKGRKLSIRASLGRGLAAFGKSGRESGRERERETQSPVMVQRGEAGMAGVGVRNVVAATATYEEKGYESAYGGVGRAA